MTTKPHKNPVGQPLKFKSVAELQKKIDAYFDHCDNRIKSIYVEKLGDHVTVSNPAPYTMSGLAVWLGVDRQTIINYEKKYEYFDTIKAARAKVEADVEERMNDKEKFTPGLIFNAKNNFGWKEKTESDVNMTNAPLLVLSTLTQKQLHGPTDSTD